MKPKEMTLSEFQSLRAKKRWKGVSKKERSEYAKRMVEAREAKKLK